MSLANVNQITKLNQQNLVNQAKLPFGQLNSLTTILEDIDNENQEAVNLGGKEMDENTVSEYNCAMPLQALQVAGMNNSNILKKVRDKI